MPLSFAWLDVFANLYERSGREARNDRDGLEPHDGLHPPVRILAGLCLAGDLVAEAFRRHVHRGPQAVVVARYHLVRRDITRLAKLRTGGESPAVVPRLHA